jgi:outer membrane protein insertion porin family
VQPPSEFDPRFRDVLVEVGERNTGSINFGAAVGSDSGVAGEFSVRQDNFDIADYPESLDEIIRARAFRGAGQRFNLVLSPGNDVSTFLIGITEPHLFESDVSLGTTAFIRERQFSQYDEERNSITVRLGRRLGDVWSVGISSRFERIELSDIDSDAPVDVFADEGPDSLSGIKISLTRLTTDEPVRPVRGSRLQLEAEQVGALGGDFDFTKLEIDYSVFLTVDEDFLGRRTILRLNTRAGWIPQDGEAPTYEKFYLGGRSFRGFDFRTVSPKGIRADTLEQGDDPIGGEWLFFAGAQYEFPIVGETMNGVFFLDTGTVTDDPGFDEYRVAAGTGIRLYIPQFGQAPLAFDFGFPIVKEDDDEQRVFSFSVQLPFN